MFSNHQTRGPVFTIPGSCYFERAVDEPAQWLLPLADGALDGLLERSFFADFVGSLRTGPPGEFAALRVPGPHASSDLTWFSRVGILTMLGPLVETADEPLRQLLANLTIRLRTLEEWQMWFVGGRLAQRAERAAKPGGLHRCPEIGCGAEPMKYVELERHLARAHTGGLHPPDVGRLAGRPPDAGELPKLAGSLKTELRARVRAKRFATTAAS